MSISCRQLVEFLIDFVSDDLPAEHRMKVEQHLLRCPPCVNYLETYKMTIKLTRELPQQPMPQQLVERLRIAMHEICADQAIRKPKPGEHP